MVSKDIYAKTFIAAWMWLKYVECIFASLCQLIQNKIFVLYFVLSPFMPQPKLRGNRATSPLSHSCYMC